LLGDLRRRRHLERDTRKVLLLLDLVGGELDVVVAITAVENHGLYARALREPERVGGRLRGATTAARGRPAARGERSSERRERRCRKGATEQAPAVQLWGFSAHHGSLRDDLFYLVPGSCACPGAGCRSLRSGQAGDALAVPRPEGVVVRVTSRDVG